MVLPAPEGPTSANVVPAGTVKVAPSSARRPVAEIGEADVADVDLDAAGTQACAHARSVRHGLDLVVDRIEPPRRPERVGKLAADVSDLRHGEKRRHREQREHGQDRRFQRIGGDQVRARRHHHESTEAGDGLQDRRLPREVGVERQPQRRVPLDTRHELLPTGFRTLERQNLREALDGVHRVRVHVPEGLAGARAEHVDTAPDEKRADGHRSEERGEGKRHRPTEPRERADDGGRYQHGDKERCHGVREEVLHEFDVMRRHAHEVAGAAPDEVGGGKPVELVEQGDAHLGEHAERHVVGEPGLEPVQHAGERGDDREGHEVRRERLAALHRSDGECAEHPDADQGHHPGYA